MTDTPKPDPESATDPATALATAILDQEMAALAALAALQALLQPASTTRTDAEIEADFDNFPV